MKNTSKFIGIIVLAAVIGFTMTGCQDTTNSDENKNENKDENKDFNGYVDINPYMDVNINTELTAVYNGTETVTLTYQWKKDDGNVGTNSKTFTPRQAGSYTITISAAGYNSITSRVVIINDPELSSLNGIIRITPGIGGIGTKLTAEYSGTETVKYQWKKNGVNVGTNSPEYTTTEAGDYNVIVSAEGYNNKISFTAFITASYIPPEDKPVADRWWKWIDPGSTATLDYSVADDGVCTITVGGTAQPNDETDNWGSWKAMAGYAYTNKAKSYEYTFEAWTQSGSRELHFGYYEDNDEDIHLTETRSITSTRTLYTISVSALPRSGENAIRLQCADQTGTFYVKIVSITER